MIYQNEKAIYVKIAERLCDDILSERYAEDSRVPSVRELATEYEGRVNIGKCDVEEDDELAMQFQVSSIPTVVFFNKQGEVFKRLVGLQSKTTLVENIEQLL